LRHDQSWRIVSEITRSCLRKEAAGKDGFFFYLYMPYFLPMPDDLYRIFLDHPVITTDSRNVPPRSIFFALRGPVFDGNRFAETALESGASFAVVDDPGCRKDERFLVVKNVLNTLQELAALHRSKLTISVVGITGTNGKTTTKELVTAILSTQYRTVATAGNLNNHIGVPLTLLTLTAETQIAIVEMGANHPGEIEFLCHLSKPTYGLITNIGRAHLEGFGSFEGVVRAKTELFRFLKETGGTVFVNRDDQLLMSHASGMKQHTYGFSPMADLSGSLIPGAETLHIEIGFPSGRETVSTRLFGTCNAMNILAAARIGMHFAVPVPSIISAIHNYVPSNNRSQVCRTGRNLLVLDAYNANPGSMPAALIDFDKTFAGNKLVILGDMLELGEQTDREHLAILELLNGLQFTHVFLVGPVFQRLNRNAGWISFPTTQEAKTWFARHPVEDMAILLKGSRGIRLEEIIGSL